MDGEHQRQTGSGLAFSSKASQAKALREQVFLALRELLDGFQHADRLADGNLLRGQQPHIYSALVSVLMRMLFVLFAEEHGLLPVTSSLYAKSYSLAGLHSTLQQDFAEVGHALHDRYDAWARVVSLFRLLHDGTHSDNGLVMPARKGALFDPETYSFLEGQPISVCPRIPDSTILRVLDHLLVVQDERIRYESFDVESLGSAYEAILGFEVCQAKGKSLALQPKDVVINLEALLACPENKRIAFLQDEADLDLKGRIAQDVRQAKHVDALAMALTRKASTRQPDLIEAGAFFLQPGEERRRFGAHYTSPHLTRIMVERTLDPLLHDNMRPDEVIALKVCDPSMGSGAFVVEACRQLATHLVHAWRRCDIKPAMAADEDILLHARKLVARHCIYGVDKNPLAVYLARLSLWLVSSAKEYPFTFVDHALRHGDSLVGLSREQIAATSLDVHQGTTLSTNRWLVEQRLQDAETFRRSIVAAVDEFDTRPVASRLAGGDTPLRDVRLVGDMLLHAFLSTQGKRERVETIQTVVDKLHAHLATGSTKMLEGEVNEVRCRYTPFHWEIEFPEVFGSERLGFDAFVGNPPWVSYAGRAAQPLSDELRDLYAKNPAFAGYRNLQGLFVARCAEMLRSKGRLGFVLPTSMSDLEGYEPSRRAHDSLCVCDNDLPDFGDAAFEGVFQPCMGLLSTRLDKTRQLERTQAWPLERTDLDSTTAALVDRLAALPKLPQSLFGERGFQTMGDDVKKLYVLSEPQGPFTVGVRVGGDIEPCWRHPPKFYCDPSVFGSRFRSTQAWRSVKLYIRQTARYPMVACSDGLAFRNSILAGFDDDRYHAPFLLAYLNSNPVRFYHYMRHRDARQGMPQVKIAHLRSLPAPIGSSSALAKLEKLGIDLGEHNSGITNKQQALLDTLAAEALGLTRVECERVQHWVASHRP